ncbi:hypothetical protein TCAL_16168 [Tigriopus californicus]|uniref:Uncharacterized protein n=1 Tax=Tigriopus californicus TaxID=6832 RepID=A0A553P1T5_TIGCA|nr:hypothetical protein TCAL_16168 [Tigriopus californicus]
MAHIAPSWFGGVNAILVLARLEPHAALQADPGPGADLSGPSVGLGLKSGFGLGLRDRAYYIPPGRGMVKPGSVKAERNQARLDATLRPIYFGPPNWALPDADGMISQSEWVKIMIA